MAIGSGLQVLSYIPIVGDCVNYFLIENIYKDLVEVSKIGDRILLESQDDTAIETCRKVRGYLKEAKPIMIDLNKLDRIGVARNLITMACVISLFAIGVFPATTASTLCTTALLLGVVINRSMILHHNGKILSRIESGQKGAMPELVDVREVQIAFL